MTLFTFAKRNSDDGSDISATVRVVGWLLSEKYHGCKADIASVSSDGKQVTLDLYVSPEIDSIACMEWYTQALAEQSLVLMHDDHLRNVVRTLNRQHR